MKMFITSALLAIGLCVPSHVSATTIPSEILPGKVHSAFAIHSGFPGKIASNVWQGDVWIAQVSPSLKGFPLWTWTASQTVDIKRGLILGAYDVMAKVIQGKDPSDWIIRRPRHYEKLAPVLHEVPLPAGIPLLLAGLGGLLILKRLKEVG